MNNERKIKRQHIIQTAAKEFANKGYDNSNINEIAVLSGIGKGTIYLYFKTKKELYLATMETVVSMFNEYSKKVLNLDCSPIERLEECIKLLFRFDDDGVPFLVLWSRYQFQNNPDFQEEVNKIFQDLEQPFCEIVKQGVEEGAFNTPYPEEAGYIILSMVVMLMPSLQVKPLLEDKSIDDKVEFIMELITNGLSCDQVN